LDAAPGAGWAFTGWSGDTSGSADPLDLVITRDRSLVANFTDVAPPTVQVTSPRGGEAWDEGTPHAITWDAADNAAVQSVTIEWSASGTAGPWLPIAAGLANSGSYVWNVPADATDSALVRVTASDAALNVASDASDSLFRVVNPNVGVPGPGLAGLALARPVPNPGRGATYLQFSLPDEADARLEIVDPLGRRVWQAREHLPAGVHTWRWEGVASDGTRVGTGLYFVRLVTPWGTRVERMTWLR
jgi:hypothetical protein